jgi:hypothetical protein
MMRIMIFVMAACLSATSSFAGEYKLVKGEELKLCQTYAKNLSKFSDDPWPMACQPQYDPSIEALSTLTWRPLALEQYLELYREAERYTATGHLSKKAMQEHVVSAEQRAKHLQADMYLSQVDLNGDGRIDNILAIRENACGPFAFLYGAPKDLVERYGAQGIDVAPYVAKARRKTRLYLLNDTATRIDAKRQRGWDAWYKNATIFLYEARPYIESFVPNDYGKFFGAGRLSIFEELPEPLSADSRDHSYRPVLKELCRFDYVPSPSSR